MRGAIGIMRRVAEVRNQGRHHRVKNTGEKGTRGNNERVRVDDDEQYGLIEKDESRHLKFFSEAKEHTVEEVKRENGAKTTEQPRPSPLRSEKKNKRPENTFMWMSRSLGWSGSENSSARQLSTQRMELGSAPG